MIVGCILCIKYQISTGRWRAETSCVRGSKFAETDQVNSTDCVLQVLYCRHCTVQLLYCSHCTDQVKSSTMRERMAAARMISTLVSSPAEESGQGADLRDTSLTTWRHLAAPGGTWSPVTWCPGARPGAPPPPPACWRPGPGCPRTPWTGSTCRGQRSHGGRQLALGPAHLRIFTSRLSSHRQVMPSSYGAHRWTMAARASREW